MAGRILVGIDPFEAQSKGFDLAGSIVGLGGPEQVEGLKRARKAAAKRRGGKRAELRYAKYDFSGYFWQFCCVWAIFGVFWRVFLAISDVF